MPGFDGTGPLGEGPMTGRGMGLRLSSPSLQAVSLTKKGPAKQFKENEIELDLRAKMGYDVDDDTWDIVTTFDIKIEDVRDVKTAIVNIVKELREALMMGDKKGYNGIKNELKKIVKPEVVDRIDEKLKCTYLEPEEYYG